MEDQSTGAIDQIASCIGYKLRRKEFPPATKCQAYPCRPGALDACVGGKDASIENPAQRHSRGGAKSGFRVDTARRELRSAGNADWRGWLGSSFKFGDLMDDITHSAERLNGSLQSPVLVIIEPLALTRTCILTILRRELAEFEIVDMATTDNLGWASVRDVRLVALDIGDKSIDDPSVEDDLALLEEFRPNASIALLSNRDDEATALAAMHRGVRGFFPTSLPDRGRCRRPASCSRRRGLQTASNRRVQWDARPRTARDAVDGSWLMTSPKMRWRKP